MSKTVDLISFALICVCLFLLARGGGLPSIVPAPIDVPGLHVLIVEEKEDRATIPAGQQSVLKRTALLRRLFREGKRVQSKIYRPL